MARGRHPTEKLLYVREILRRFPSISTRSAAIMAFKERPDLYKTFVNARTRVQYARGQIGAIKRKCVRDKSQFTTASKTAALSEALFNLP